MKGIRSRQAGLVWSWVLERLEKESQIGGEMGGGRLPDGGCVCGWIMDAMPRGCQARPKSVSV